MPKEIRYILFQNNEAEAAVLMHVAPPEAQRAPKAGPDAAVRFSETEDDGPFAIVTGLVDPQGATVSRRLNEIELRGAMLAWCGMHGVPLPRRGMKSVELLGSRLAMTITLNAATKDVQADKGRVRYADPALQGFRPVM